MHPELAAARSKARSRMPEPRTNEAPHERPITGSDDEIKRLAHLGHLDYAATRKDAAKKLGIGVGILDTAVKAARRQNSSATAIGQGRP
jgi:hypothetical protein